MDFDAGSRKKVGLEAWCLLVDVLVQRYRLLEKSVISSSMELTASLATNVFGGDCERREIYCAVVEGGTTICRKWMVNQWWQDP